MESSHVATVRPRLWYVAAGMNVFNGIGYLYLGRPIRAALAATWTLVSIAAVGHGLNGWFATFFGWFVLVSTSLGVLAFLLIDAVRIARHEQAYTLRAYNKWYVYLGSLAALISVTLFEPFASAFVGAPIRTFSIPSRSMAPTLQLGDYVVADTRAYRNAAPTRGDVAVFVSPKESSVTFVKRVVGLPGDTVQMVRGVLHINGAAVATKPNGEFVQPADEVEREMKIPQVRETLADGRSYDTLDFVAEGPADNTRQFTVPAGHYFVLGDNRDNSYDSRFPSVGFVPERNFVGRMMSIVWSRNPRRIGSRVE